MESCYISPCFPKNFNAKKDNEHKALSHLISDTTDFINATAHKPRQFYFEKPTTNVQNMKKNYKKEVEKYKDELTDHPNRVDQEALMRLEFA